MHSSQFSGTKATADRVYIHCTLHARAGLCKNVRVCPYNLCMHACMHTYIHDFLTEPNVYLATYLLCLSIIPDVSADLSIYPRIRKCTFIHVRNPNPGYCSGRCIPQGPHIKHHDSLYHGNKYLVIQY